MKLSLRFVLILTAVVAAAFLVLAVACGDDEEEAPAATPTVSAEETPEKPPTGEEGELPAIAYPGATEVSSGTFTGAGAFPIPMVGDGGLDPEDYGSVQYTIYETSDSPQEVLSFYNNYFKDWEEVWTFSMEELGQKGEVAVWSKDDGNAAAWVAAFEDDGTTSVVVAMGAR